MTETSGRTSSRQEGTASTPKGERRRQELVEAASALLVEGGFDAVRHRAVAERAGLPLASTTYYFDSLDDLVAAAVEHQGRAELERSAKRWQELSDEQQGTIEATVELLLDHLLGPRQPESEADYEAVLSRYERLVATGRRRFLRPLMREMGARMDELLLGVLERGGFAVDRQAVDRLVALVDGTVVNALIEVDPHPRDAAARALLAELRG